MFVPQLSSYLLNKKFLFNEGLMQTNTLFTFIFVKYDLLSEYEKLFF